MTHSLNIASKIQTVSCVIFLIVCNVGHSFAGDRTWNGGAADNLASSANNWAGQVAPVAGDNIILDGTSTKDISWDLDISVLNWTQTSAYTGNVTIYTEYSGFDDFDISGDLTIDGGTWNHRVNTTLETYRLKVTVGGNFSIGASAAINVKGQGYDKEKGPGAGTYIAGGAYGGESGNYPGGTIGLSYGSVIAPDNIGSGSGLNAGGAKGGGAVWLVVSGTTQLSGNIIASGGDPASPTAQSASGAGGSIYLKTESLSGSGTISVNGGIAGSIGGGGSGGRIAVLLTSGTSFGSVVFQAHGGPGGTSLGDPGAAGTIYKEKSTDAAGQGAIIIDNNDQDTAATTAIPVGDELNVYDLTLQNKGLIGVPTNTTLNLLGTISTDADNNEDGIAAYGGNITLVGNLIVEDWTLRVNDPTTLGGNVHVKSGGLVNHSDNSTAESHKVNLTINGDLTVDAGGEFNVSALGYDKTYGPGAGVSTSGGGHGGEGGDYITGTIGSPYGSVIAPDTIGSGSGQNAGGASGGGAIWVVVNGATQLSGNIIANGGNPSSPSAQSPSGAGGSVYLKTQTLSGNGEIKANGGVAGTYGGGGSGGRIAVILTSGSSFGSVLMQAHGGPGGTVLGDPGAAGTVFTKTSSQTYGELLVENDNQSTESKTGLNEISVTDLDIDSLQIDNLGQFLIGDDDSLTVAGNISVSSNSYFHSNGNGLIDVSGDWNNEGVFTAEGVGGNVILSGSFQNVQGDNSFYHLSKQVTSSDNITFEEGKTQLILGDMILTGNAASNKLSLRSSVDGQEWEIDPRGNRTVAFLDVKDSHKLNEFNYIPIDASGNTNTDSGNNSNWIFDPVAAVTLSFSPEAYQFIDEVDVTIIPSSNSLVTIYYTTDGSVPDNTDISYTLGSEITINETTLIKAIAYYDEGGAGEIIGNVFSKTYYSIPEEDLYARKTYGQSSMVYSGDVRRFEGQVWWVGPDGEPDDMGGDDIRIPELDDDIVWTATSGTIVQTTGSSEGGAAIFTSNGTSANYTVTLTIGPNGYTGCNNNQPCGGAQPLSGGGGQSVVCITKKCPDKTICTIEDNSPDNSPKPGDKDGTAAGSNNNTGTTSGAGNGQATGQSAPAPSETPGKYGMPPANNSGGESSPSPAAAPGSVSKGEPHKGRGGSKGGANKGRGGVKGGGSRGGAKGPRPNEVVKHRSPIPLPTKGKAIKLNINLYSGAYDLRSFSFGRAARITFFHEMRVISSSQVNIFWSTLDDPSWSPYKNGGSGPYTLSIGNEGFVTKINDTKYTYNSPENNVLTFEDVTYDNTDNLRLTKFVDQNGNTITIDYQSATLCVITDASGNEYKIEANTVVDGVNLVSKITTDPVGSSNTKSWTYAYTVDGFLTSETFDNLSFVYEYELDRHGNLTKFTDYNGNESNYTYNDTWFITSMQTATGEFINISHSGTSGGITSTFTDPDGNVTKKTYLQTVNGVLLKQIDYANGLVRAYEHDSDGWISKSTEKLTGRAADNIDISYEYDSYHNITKKIVDDGGLNLTESFVFNGNRLMTQKTDAEGVVTTFAYNGNNHLTARVVDSGNLNLTTTYEYDNVGNLVATTDPTGKVKSFAYDSKNQLTSYTDELGNVESYAYDEFGNRTSYTDRNGNVTSYEFDDLNRLTKVTDPAGFTEEYVYDKNSNLTRFTDRIGAVTVYTYDAQDRMTKIAGDAGAPGGCGSCGGTDVNGIEGDYEYNWRGDLVKFTDIEGLVTDYEYDEVYKQSKITKDSTGLNIQTTFDYDRLMRRTKVTNINNNGSDVVTEYEWDKGSRRVKRKRTLGASTVDREWIYDDMNNVIKTIDENGNAYEVVYDNNYRIITSTDAEGLVINRTYNDRDELVKITRDPSGFNYVTEFVYDAARRIVLTTEPDGGVSQSAWDDHGNLISTTDPNNNVNVYTFDNRHLLVGTTDPASFETTFTYDGLGNRLTVTDSDGMVTVNIYDEKSFLLQSTGDSGGIDAQRSQERDELMHITKTTDAFGVKRKFTLDAIYRVTKVTEDEGGVEVENEKEFDSLSRVVKRTDAAGNETDYTFDQLNRVTKIEFPDGGQVDYTYDNLNNVTQEDRKINGTDTMVTKYEYDNLYRLTKTIKDFGGEAITTTRTYDVLGRLITIKDSNNNETDYEYDEENRITLETYADGGNIIREYDLKGRMTKMTDQNNDVCEYFYDSRDLLTSKLYGTNVGASGGNQEFTYDSLRRLTQSIDDNPGRDTITASFEYDKLHRLISESQQIGTETVRTIQKEVDAFGHVVKTTLPGGRFCEFTWTNLHQIDTIKTSSGASGNVLVADYDYEYDSSGDGDLRPILESKTLHSDTGINADYSYDEMARITTLNWTTGSGSVVGFDYTYDVYGNRLTDTHKHNSAHNESYTYDSAQRLTGYDRGSGAFTQDWTLDDLGNWTTFDDNGDIDNRTHNSVNEVTIAAGNTITYDDNGNLTDDDTQEYVWDELNRLIEVKDKSSGDTIAKYSYDTMNRRVVKHLDTDSDGDVDSSDDKIGFYWCDQHLVEERGGAGSGNVIVNYVSSHNYVDEVILMTTSTSDLVDAKYYLCDLRYSVYGFVDQSGQVVERYQYDPYGKRAVMDKDYTVLGSATVDQRFGYTGREHDDESGLMNFRNRYYSVELGRFISRDMLGYVDGMSLYRGYFVPIGVDPWGNRVITFGPMGHPIEGPATECCAGNAPMVTDDTGADCCSEDTSVVTIRNRAPERPYLEQLGGWAGVWGIMTGQQDIPNPHQGANFDPGHTWLEFESGEQYGVWSGGIINGTGQAQIETVRNNNRGHTSSRNILLCSGPMDDLRNSLFTSDNAPNYYPVLLSASDSNFTNCTAAITGSLSSIGVEIPGYVTNPEVMEVFLSP